MTDRPVALVTGASSGIGRSFAHELARRGHDLVLVARDEARLAEVVDEVGRSAAVAVVLAADLSDPAQLAKVEDRVAAVDAPVELLVNNAGYGTFGKFWELPLEKEASEIRLNVVALTRLAHAAAGQMVERRAGGIINISSIAAYQPTPMNAVYGATKAFVSSFSQALHEELKPFGVKCMVVAPGFTRTEFQDRAGLDSSQAPDFLWQEADTVVRHSLDDYAKGKGVSVPGPLNTATAAFSSMMPAGVTRKIAAAVIKRSE